MRRPDPDHSQLAGGFPALKCVVALGALCSQDALPVASVDGCEGLSWWGWARVHSGPTPAQGLGRSFPPSHAAGLGVTCLRSFGASFPIVPSAEAGGGGGAWGSWLLGSIVGTPSPPVCLVADLENLHRLLGSTVCGPYAYPEPSPGCWGEGWPPWDPRQDPRPRTGAHTQLAEGSAGRPEHRHAGSSPEPRGADGAAGAQPGRKRPSGQASLGRPLC